MNLSVITFTLTFGVGLAAPFRLANARINKWCQAETHGGE